MISTCGLRMALSRRSVTFSRGWRRDEVQRGQHQVERGQELVRIIQRAVGLDLHFGGVQDADAVAELALGLLDLGLLFGMALHAQAVGHSQADRMVGEGDDFDARAWRRRGPSRACVSFPSLQLEWTCRSAWMSASSISFGNFPALAAWTSPWSSRSLGGDPGQAQGGVDLLFGGAEDLAGAICAEQGVLGERQTFIEGQLAQAHVVVLRAGGIDQGGAEVLRRMDPQLGAQPVAELDAGLGGSLPQHAADPGQRGEGLHHRGRLLAQPPGCPGRRRSSACAAGNRPVRQLSRRGLSSRPR